MKDTKIISTFIAVFSMVIFGMSENSYGEEIDRHTFLLKNNTVFVMRLDTYQSLLNGPEINENIANRIEDLIKLEIQSFDDWARLYYDHTALPAGVSKISPLSAGEHYSRIKSLLDEMRTAVMGYHRDLRSDSTLIEKIDVLKNLASDLDKLLGDRMAPSRMTPEEE